MDSKTRPDTTNRDKLLKELIGRGTSNDIIARTVAPMRGKTQEEKERIVLEILKNWKIKTFKRNKKAPPKKRCFLYSVVFNMVLLPLK